MNRTDLALELAPPASAARMCGDVGHGYQWRSGFAMNVLSINATATKPTARRLGMLTT